MQMSQLTLEELNQLEKQLKADLDAVRRVREMVMGQMRQKVRTMVTMEDKSPPAPAESPPQRPAETELKIAPSVGVVVERIVQEIEGRFTIGTVKKRLYEARIGLHPDSSIRSALNRLVDRGILEVVTLGGGRRGSVLQRVDS